MALLAVTERKPDHSLGSICEDLAKSNGTPAPAAGEESPKEEPKATITQRARQYWKEANEATNGWLPYMVGAGVGYVWLKKRNK